jgi:hypothetical protein
MNWQWAILIVVVMVVLAFSNWQRSQRQIADLSQSGFQISDDLKGQPQLLLDRQARQFAVVRPDGREQHTLDEVARVELRFDPGVQQPENYRVVLHLKAGREIEIHYENEWLAQDQLKRLQPLLTR